MTPRESLLAAMAAMSNGQWIFPESRDIACECISEHGPVLLAALDALNELVACKELKDMLALDFTPEYLAQHRAELEELRSEYERRKPLAWKAAIDAARKA